MQGKIGVICTVTPFVIDNNSIFCEYLSINFDICTWNCRSVINIYIYIYIWNNSVWMHIILIIKSINEIYLSQHAAIKSIAYGNYFFSRSIS